MKSIAHAFELSAMKSDSTSINNTSLGLPLLASILLHAAATLLLIAVLLNQSRGVLQEDFIPIALIEIPKAAPKEQTPARDKRPSPPIQHKTDKPISQLPMPRPVSPTAVADPRKPAETGTKVSPDPEPVEDGGREAGAENLFANGDPGLLPGAGRAGDGGGSTAAGLGTGSGAPGLPAPTTVIKTNREAIPIQTARASYPPMALRMGLEGDVTLRIEVDTEGKVTRVEITKSGGAGFDEEALRAVKQSRFEPAQKDGQKVPAEFTYVYHFRLSK
jgi:protein TonB